MDFNDISKYTLLNDLWNQYYSGICSLKRSFYETISEYNAKQNIVYLTTVIRISYFIILTKS